MKKRNGVLALLCIVSAITFLDRLALPIAEPGIRADLGLSPEQWGWVLSAYVLANAAFEIPSGASGDRRGQRRELTRIVLWWSTFTAVTSACRGFLQVTASRFLFGVGAAGAYPNAAGVISRWFPKREHARAQGFVWAGSRLGGALAPLLLAPFALRFGWRSMFVLLGLLGLIWAAVWWRTFRTDPADSPGISVQEIMDIGADGIDTHTGPAQWRQLLRLRHLWLVTVAYFAYAFGSWFYYGWFPTWMVRGAGFSRAEMSVFASLPFLMGIGGNLLGGSLSERLVTRYGRRLTYRWLTGVSLTCTAALLFGMTLVHTHAAIGILSTLGFGIMDLMLPSAWAMCMSVGGRFGGTATGVMNTAGNLGGWFCTVLFGHLVGATGNYNLPLKLIAAMVLLAAILFSQVDCTRGLQDDPRLSRVG